MKKPVDQEIADRAGRDLTKLMRMPAGAAPIMVEVRDDAIVIDWGEGADVQEMARRPELGTGR